MNVADAHVGTVVLWDRKDWTIKAIFALGDKTVLKLGKGRYGKNRTHLPTEAIVKVSDVKLAKGI